MIRFTVTRYFPNRPAQISYYSCNVEEARRIVGASKGHKVEFL